MLRTRVRRLIGIGCLAVLVTVLSTFVGTVGASAVKSPPSGTKTWRLVDYQQHGCFSPNVHDSWFGIYINGRWTTSLDIGASNLPAGGTLRHLVRPHRTRLEQQYLLARLSGRPLRHAAPGRHLHSLDVGERWHDDATGPDHPRRPDSVRLLTASMA
jgi:hypothetical protein